MASQVNRIFNLRFQPYSRHIRYWDLRRSVACSLRVRIVSERREGAFLGKFAETIWKSSKKFRATFAQKIGFVFQFWTSSLPFLKMKNGSSINMRDLEEKRKGRSKVGWQPTLVARAKSLLNFVMAALMQLSSRAWSSAEGSSSLESRLSKLSELLRENVTGLFVRPLSGSARPKRVQTRLKAKSIKSWFSFISTSLLNVKLDTWRRFSLDTICSSTWSTT